VATLPNHGCKPDAAEVVETVTAKSFEEYFGIGLADAEFIEGSRVALSRGLEFVVHSESLLQLINI
jgi:hypothetical protein